AAILLDCASGMSDSVVAAVNGVNRHTVALCARKFLQFGLEVAMGELPRPGQARRITDDSIAWVQNLACQKPKDLGYSYELWTYGLLQRHIRKEAVAAGHPSLSQLSRSKVHCILTQGEVKPHKVRYYVERRDPEFEKKMIEVLHVYKEVEIINSGLVEGTLKEPPTVTISYDEKPGIQALATTTPDRPPVPKQHPSHLRDYEYIRLGTVSLLAGLDLHTGSVIEIVRDSHASADFIALLEQLDSKYPAQTRIRLLLDNHSAHISKQTKAYLNLHPQRFEFVFTPKHGCWLNIVETMFSKMARTMLRGIRVASKQELIDRIHLYYDEINADPVIFRWKYKMDETVGQISTE
ncbi:MAG TPA: IS630 family transposase, partial [Bryobacteraceae bacterium]|nr:IS630 family transposase [Bryobacteraceae bacterium]